MEERQSFFGETVEEAIATANETIGARFIKEFRVLSDVVEKFATGTGRGG